MLVALLSWSTITMAFEPEVEVTDGGLVQGTILVTASPSAVQAWVSDPVKMAEAVGGGIEVSARPDGDCQTVVTRSPTSMMEVNYTVRRCPTAQGFSSTLTVSDDLSHFTDSWTVVSAEGGSRVTYGLDVRPKIPVPGFLLRRSTRRGVRDALAAIERVFAASSE